MQTGDEARITGLGMPNLTRDGRNDGRKGDLVLHLNVVTPRKLTKRQEELLRELGEIDGVNVSPEHKSFLERIKEFFSPSEGAGGRTGGEGLTYPAARRMHLSSVRAGSVSDGGKVVAHASGSDG